MKCVYFSQNVDEWMKVKRMNKQQMEFVQTGAGQKNNHFVIEYDSMYFFSRLPTSCLWASSLNRSWRPLWWCPEHFCFLQYPICCHVGNIFLINSFMFFSLTILWDWVIDFQQTCFLCAQTYVSMCQNNNCVPMSLEFVYGERETPIVLLF